MKYYTKKINLMSFAYVIIIFLISAAGYQVNAQAYLDFNVNAVYDNNINDTYTKVEDLYSIFDAEFGYNFISSKTDFGVYYNGTASVYKKYTDRFNHKHTIGASFYTSLNKNRSSGFGMNGSYFISLNKDEYSYLDYYNLNGVAGFDASLSKRWNLNAIFSIDYINLKEYKVLNNLEHNLLLKVAGYLPWKSSLVISSGFGYKVYLDNQTSTLSKGKHGNINGSINAKPENLMIGYGSISYTQTLFKNFGIRLKLSGNKTFAKENVYVNEYINQDNIFEDRFSSDELSGEINFTQLLPKGFSVKTDFTYIYDYFPGRPAYDLNSIITASNRIDKFFGFGLSLLKNFGRINIGLTYNYNSNSSNDSYFNYTKNIISLWFSAGF